MKLNWKAAPQRSENQVSSDSLCCTHTYTRDDYRLILVRMRIYCARSCHEGRALNSLRALILPAGQLDSYMCTQGGCE